MPRALTGYLAGAAFALTAAAALAVHAQPAPAANDAAQAAAQADRDAGPADVRVIRRELKNDDKADKAGDKQVRHEERRIIIRDGEHEFAMAGHGHHTDMAEHLRTMLQLKPAQEPALQAYLTAVRQPMGREHVMAMADHKDGAPPRTTTERLADMEKHMAEQQAAAHARIDATRKFYAQLGPSQKKVFDEMPMLMIGPIGPLGPMIMADGPMKMIRFEHGPGANFEYRIERHPPMPPVPPVPPVPPAPPKS